MTRKERQLQQLAEEVNRKQSFSIKTLKDSYTAVTSEDFRIEFDALSLCVYRHNLNDAEWNEFGKYLTREFEGTHGREEIKARIEYGRLLHFMLAAPEYSEMAIDKEERPDFVLRGSRTVGVEVTELTTAPDEVLHAIVKENMYGDKSAEAIKQAAIERHGQKATEYNYIDFNGMVGVGSPVFDMKEKKREYACEIAKKYDKYCDMFKQFDEFIILCDAQKSNCISNKEDSNEVMEIVRTFRPDIQNCTACILRENEGKEDRGRLWVIDRYRL